MVSAGSILLGVVVIQLCSVGGLFILHVRISIGLGHWGASALVFWAAPRGDGSVPGGHVARRARPSLVAIGSGAPLRTVTSGAIGVAARAGAVAVDWGTIPTSAVVVPWAGTAAPATVGGAVPSVSATATTAVVGDASAVAAPVVAPRATLVTTASSARVVGVVAPAAATVATAPAVALLVAPFAALEAAAFGASAVTAVAALTPLRAVLGPTWHGRLACCTGLTLTLTTTRMAWRHHTQQAVDGQQHTGSRTPQRRTPSRADKERAECL